MKPSSPVDGAGDAAVSAQHLRIALSSGRHRSFAFDDLSFTVPAARSPGSSAPRAAGRPRSCGRSSGCNGTTGNCACSAPAGSPGIRGLIGYAIQAVSVYPDLTGKQNLDHFARITGVPRTDLEARLGLEPHRNRKVSTLSDGERSRVSLGCALASDPPLLVMDEPTVGLDLVLRARLWADFRELADDGHTLIISSHVMDEAARCDRLLVLRDGRTLWQGEPDTLLGQTGATNFDDAFLVSVGVKGGRR